MSEISIKQATIYNAMSKYGTMIVQLGLTMVLSRLILPEAFGVIAIITVVLGFLNLFADMGLGISVIQHPDMSKDDINKLFTFSFVVGLLLAVFTVALSVPLVSFYEDEVYYRLCALVAPVSFLNAVNVVPNAILTRDKRFKTIALRSIICAVVSGIVAVALAYIGWGVYALIMQSIISALFLFLWNYSLSPLKLIGFKTKTVLSLLGRYSLFQILFNFLNYFTRNLDHLLIGKYFGSASLGYYNKSYSLYLYPNSIFTSVITGVIHPFIRDYKNDYERMYEKYLQIEKFLSLIGIITMMVTFFCATEIVVVMFGENWEPAGVYLKCLSICMWSQMISSVPGSVFLGLERTDQSFKCGLINLALLIASIFIGVFNNSLTLLALCVGVSYNLIFLTTNYILLNKTMRISVIKFLRVLMPDAVFAFTFCGVTLLVPSFIKISILSLIIKVAICIVAYVIYLSLTGRIRSLINLLGLVKKK